MTTSTHSADVESIPENMKTGGNNLSLPNIANRNSENIKSCLSLPSHLELQKTLLGLAIVIESNSQNQEMLSSYLQSISTTIEECIDWFSTVASKAYCSPSTFVQTLYNFSQEFKSLLYSRLTMPLISTVELSSNWKALPSISKELINLLLRLDKCNCKTNDRIKLVLVGSPKKVQEISSLFYLFKVLLLQCNEELGLDATTVCKNNTTTSPKREELPLLSSQRQKCSFFSKLSSQSQSFVEVSSLNTSPSSSISSAAAVEQLNIKVPTPKFENESMQKKDYDSGIDLSFSSSSVKSMKRSSSQKFDSMCKSPPPFEPIDLFSYPSSSHTYEEVSFHLGELDRDGDQSINTLELSDPNPEKLKNAGHRSISKRKDAFIEPVQEEIEQLSLEPIQVILNFAESSSNGHSITTAKHHVSAYCQYCDSMAVVDKFSPLYYIQWVKASDLPEESFNLMQTFTPTKYLIINLDKNIIRPINFDFSSSTKEMICSNFVSNLIEKIQVLTLECRENEIEDYLNIKLDYIKHIAHKVGTKLNNESSSPSPNSPWSNNTSNNTNIIEENCLNEKDLNLIHCMAKLKFPDLVNNIII